MVSQMAHAKKLGEPFMAGLAKKQVFRNKPKKPSFWFKPGFFVFYGFMVFSVFVYFFDKELIYAL